MIFEFLKFSQNYINILFSYIGGRGGKRGPRPRSESWKAALEEGGKGVCRGGWGVDSAATAAPAATV